MVGAAVVAVVAVVVVVEAVVEVAVVEGVLQLVYAGQSAAGSTTVGKKASTQRNRLGDRCP